MFISTTRKPTQPTAREGLQAPVGGHVGKATCLLPFPDPAVIEHTRTWQSLNLRTRPTQAVVTVPGCHRRGRAPPRRRRGVGVAGAVRSDSFPCRAWDNGAPGRALEGQHWQTERPRLGSKGAGATERSPAAAPPASARETARACPPASRPQPAS